jgi:hypothetical protein
MMLTILVFGPKQPSDRIDVYLRPLVDDLKILWKQDLCATSSRRISTTLRGKTG